MLKATVKSLLGRKLRLLMSTFAITSSYQAASGLRPAIASGSTMFSWAVSVGTRL